MEVTGRQWLADQVGISDDIGYDEVPSLDRLGEPEATDILVQQRLQIQELRHQVADLQGKKYNSKLVQACVICSSRNFARSTILRMRKDLSGLATDS